MFAYINIFKPKINVKDITYVKGWTNNTSVNDVLKNIKMIIIE